MKRYIKSSKERPYLYIFKHGIGPGTLPRDVEVIKTKDLPNYYTAVWLDRFLTTDELKQYDIPSETRINELLDRIGYCQKNGDVVPCDDVLASSYIKSAREPKWWGSTYSCQVIDAYNKGELTYKNMEEWETEYNGGFKPSNMGTKGILDYYIKTGKDPRDDVEACGDIKASKTYHFSRYNGESYTTRPDGTKVLSRKVLQRSVLDMLEDNDKYMNLDFCDAEEITEKATPEELLAIYDEEMTSDEFKALYNRIFGVKACGNIMATTYVSQVWLPDDKKWEDIQEYNKWDNSWCEGCGTGPYYDIEDARADGYRARIIVRDESGRYVDDIEVCGNIMASEYGKFPSIPDDRFEFIVYDIYMYDDIMEAIDNVCESITSELYSEKFCIEGPYSERFDVIDVLKDFGVDWEEV